MNQVVLRLLSIVCYVLSAVILIVVLSQLTAAGTGTTALSAALGPFFSFLAGGAVLWALATAVDELTRIREACEGQPGGTGDRPMGAPGPGNTRSGD